MSETKNISNQSGETVFKELKKSIKKGSKLSIVSAYFSMYAYNKLKQELDGINSLRFIFTSPSFVKDKNIEAREYFIDNNAADNLFGDEFEMKLKNEMTQGFIARECSKWIKDKVEFKSFIRPNTAQPRMIHCKNKNTDDFVIQGSVDFTTDGLGITPSNRADNNTLFIGDDLSTASLMFFDTIWNEDSFVESVKSEVLEHMKVMYKENTPEFIYFLSLYNIFYDYLKELDDDPIVKKGNSLKETNIWNHLYKFQKDAVIGAIDKIEKYNGCIIADSVGLGKTFTALAIIQYYELRNDRVLVLVPKKLRDNWTIYTLNDKRNIFAEDRFRYDVLNHTDLSRDYGKSGDIDLKTINWGNYDLVVIDESHNFRNNPAVKDRTTRYDRLMNNIIKSGHKTKLLMLSATPVNNKMNDIKNQIAFITEDNDSALEDVGIKSINYTLKNAQHIFNKWSELNDNKRTGEQFVDMMDLDYFKLLDILTIARSRKHIEKYYNLDEIGKFPERLSPINANSDIDIMGEFPSFKEINNEIGRLNLGIFSPLLYIRHDKIADYDRKYDTNLSSGRNLKQRDREKSLVTLMRINLLKRMESSVHSFKLTIERLLTRINRVLDKIEKGVEYNPDIDIKLIDPDEEEYDDLMFGNKSKVLYQDMDLIKWEQDLRLDKEKLENLLEEVNKVTPERDEKLDDLKKQISTKIENPINEGNKKVIVFTAFADTAKYLYENISKWILDKYGLYTALVTGSDTNKSTLKNIQTTDINDILINFSPKSKERTLINPEASDEIDILICTDCISEGQNLQDCDYLINYDIHWNPVRIIQRFGRIDRIGSENKYIQLVNFWPNMELDEYINLKGRVENRMVMVDVSATGEENIILDSSKKEMNDLEYRKKQLERLQEKVVDLEDISNGISITDLTFNDFKMSLMNYMEENQEELEKSPNGIYALVPIPEELKDEIEPGVIFLLKQLRGKEETKDRNALTPYYLVYINEDKQVKLNYVQSKKILDYYQKICTGQKKIYKELVQDFEEETNNGKDMHGYSTLLSTAIDNILGKKDEIGVKSLFSKGGTATIINEAAGLDEFELITFLIIK